MRWVRFAVFILVVTLLQDRLRDVLAVTRWGIKPDLLLILMVFFAVYCNTTDAIIASFATGFAADLIGQAMGAHMISFGVVGTLLAYLHKYVAVRRLAYQALIIFVAGVLTGLATYYLNMVKGHAAVENIYVIILFTSLYSAVIGPFFFLSAAWLMRIKTERYGRT
jgi:rod shape-determining protein MreD